MFLLLLIVACVVSCCCFSRSIQQLQFKKKKARLKYGQPWTPRADDKVSRLIKTSTFVQLDVSSDCGRLYFIDIYFLACHNVSEEWNKGNNLRSVSPHLFLRSKMPQRAPIYCGGAGWAPPRQKLLYRCLSCLTSVETWRGVVLIHTSPDNQLVLDLFTLLSIDERDLCFFLVTSSTYLSCRGF